MARKGTVTPQVRAQSRPESRPESQLESRLESKLATSLLLAIAKESYGKQALAHKLGHSTVSGELKKQILRLLDMSIIEMTIPDKPNSRLQKYRITDKGRALLDMSMKKGSKT